MDIIKTDGTIETEEREEPFTLNELQKIINGYIEIIKMHDGRIMVVDEEGLIKKLPYNEEATSMIQTATIYGDALVCDSNMVE